jgi:hypothetical protein
MADSGAPNQLFDAWRRQFEEAAQTWSRMLTQAAPPPPTDPTAFWRPVLNQGLETWAKIFAQTPVTPDLMAQWKQFLDQWIEAWSKALGQAMGSDAYAQMMGKHLEQWLVAYAPMKKAAEQQIDQTLAALNVASRSQLTSVARQLVEVDERIERLEDMLARVLTRLEQGAK